MKLPLSLIKSFIQTDLPAEELGEILTMLGLELDRIENPKPSFENVVIGEVLSVEKHPDAKHLQIAVVSDGKEKFQVVCGASNCRAGIKTAFAKIGAKLRDENGQISLIQKTTIRGIESFGMLASGKELNISNEDEGILELPLEMETGSDASLNLWDPILEISLTPNLGHCMSALGVARELSAALQIPVKAPKKPDLKLNLSKKVTIENYTLCPRYVCIEIEGVRVGPSPFWLKQMLAAFGQKSINNIVDLTNFIMMKLGNPLHAFDLDLLEGEELRIAPAQSALKFVGLDDIEREVPEGALLIFDAKKPVAIAGVMGGANSAVSEKTTRILLESAYFDPISIRKTAKTVGLRTESSQRFEKGVDPLALELAAHEAALLMEGSITGFADLKDTPLVPKTIQYQSKRINALLGSRLSETEIEEIFQRLQIEAKNGTALVPLYRHDLKEAIDLTEEVARIYGYNNIEKRPPLFSSSNIPNDPVFLFENEMRHRLVALGLTEFLTCDLVSPKLAQIMQTMVPKEVKSLQTVYSKSEEFSVLRTSLLPGLLNVLKGNLAQKNTNVSAFEIGRIHFEQKGQITEIPMVSILLTGEKSSAHWSAKPTQFDYFDLKGMIESLIQAKTLPGKHPSFHPHRQADVQIENLNVGSIGEIHPTLLEQFDIEQRVFYAELNLLHLLEKKKSHIKVKPLAQFPASSRDWTISLEMSTPIQKIFEAIEIQNSELLESAHLIDQYLPEESQQKNMTFRFIYRDLYKTISFDEVEKEHAKMIDSILNLLAK